GDRRRRTVGRRQRHRAVPTTDGRCQRSRNGSSGRGRWSPMVIHLAALAVSGMSMLGLSNTGRICVVDMGSNSFKLIVGEVADGAYIERHVERKKLGVGDDMSKTGRIAESKVEGRAAPG